MINDDENQIIFALLSDSDMELDKIMASYNWISHVGKIQKKEETMRA